VGLFIVGKSSAFGLAVDALALLAAFTGIFAERLKIERDRRNQAVKSVTTELAKNDVILKGTGFSPMAERDRTPRVYPRLLISAVETTLISGGLTNDDRLLEALHEWRDLVGEFNRRLQVTELRMIVAASEAEIVALDRALHQEGGYMDDVRDLLADLNGRLFVDAHAQRAAS